MPTKESQFAASKEKFPSEEEEVRLSPEEVERLDQIQSELETIDENWNPMSSLKEMEELVKRKKKLVRSKDVLLIKKRGEEEKWDKESNTFYNVRFKKTFGKKPGEKFYISRGKGRPLLVLDKGDLPEIDPDRLYKVEVIKIVKGGRTFYVRIFK